MGKRLSLAELVGKDAASKGESLSLHNLSRVLGPDNTPELPRNAVGRFRLVRSLKHRFGANFRALPGVKNLLKEFDDEVHFEDRIAQLRNVRMRGKNG